MGSALSTLVAVIVGGLISGFGTFLIARYQAQREEARLSSQMRREDERLARERLRENLYRLQDALEEVFRHYDAAMKDPPTVAPHPGVTSAVIRINMQSIRVGDDRLAASVSAVLEKLSEARKVDTSYAKGEAFNAALALLSPVQQRVGELLHTDAKVDLGV